MNTVTKAYKCPLGDGPFDITIVDSAGKKLSGRHSFAIIIGCEEDNNAVIMQLHPLLKGASGYVLHSIVKTIGMLTGGILIEHGMPPKAYTEMLATFTMGLANGKAAVIE